MLALLIGVSLAHALTGTQVAAQLESWRAHRGIETAPKIPSSAYQKALDGQVAKGIEVIEDIKAAKGYGVAVFDIPIAQMWKAIADEDHHAHNTSVKMSETIQGTPRTHDHTIFQFLDIPVFTDRWWLVNIKYTSGLYTASGGKIWEITWQDRNKSTELVNMLDLTQFDDAIPVAWTKGAWLLMALDDGRTLIEYHTWSDPGGSVPVGLATRFAAGEVEQNLRNMAKFAQGHTPTCTAQFHRPDGSPL
jgi:hypothetical protein